MLNPYSNQVAIDKGKVGKLLIKTVGCSDLQAVGLCKCISLYHLCITGQSNKVTKVVNLQWINGMNPPNFD